ILVAYLPVLEPIVLGYIRIPDPVGRLLRRASSVVDRNKRLSVDALCHAGKLVEIRRPRPGVVVGSVRTPVIVIRQRSARKASYASVIGSQKRSCCGSRELVVPDRAGYAKESAVNRALNVVGVDVQIHNRGWRRR